MTGIVAGWLLRPETLALASITLLVVWAARPIAEYLDREVPLEGEMDFAVGRPLGAKPPTLRAFQSLSPPRLFR